MNDTTQGVPAPEERVERALTPVHYAFILFILIAGGMFCFKLFSFLSTIKRDELAGFAYDPMITYGFVAMGFLCLLMWAYASGQFRDVERPKHDLFERFDDQEQRENEYFDGERRGGRA